MHEKKNHWLIEAYLERRPALRRFLVARFRDEATADDILQEMYLKLARTELPAEIENAPAFLYQVANNLALDWRKKRLRQENRDSAWAEAGIETPGAEPAQKAVDPDVALDAKRQLAALVEALKELPPQCRAVFIAHKFQSLSHREVAAKFGIGRSTVEKHMSKALRYLVHHLKDRNWQN